MRGRGTVERGSSEVQGKGARGERGARGEQERRRGKKTMYRTALHDMKG
jgi:hypothetical protein